MKALRTALSSTSSLGFRLGSMLVLALLPLGVLSMVQAQMAREQIRQTTLDGIGGATFQAVEPQITMIRDAQTTVRLLAQDLGRGLPEAAECVARLRALAKAVPEASVMGYIPMSGQMDCASNGRRHNFAGDPVFNQMIARPEPTLVFNPHGPVSGRAVIGISHPVLDAGGRQIGVAAIAIPNQAITLSDYAENGAEDSALWQPALILAFTGNGTRLASSLPEAEERRLMPEGVTPTTLATEAGAPRFVTSPDGRERILSVAAVADDLFLTAIWQPEEAHNWLGSAFAPYLLPALTWAAALLAAAFGAEWLVVRHVRALTRAMTAHGSGTRAPLPDTATAPTEIRRLHAVYDQLLETIDREEAELQNLLVDKELLLRETHHRSGNSLQVIASVMRMYRRETTDPGLRAVLDGLINRVIALSATHTSLYSQTGRRDVPMDEILSGVVRRLKDIHGIALGTASKQFDPIRMPVQAAVPLALALTETITCHFSAKNRLGQGGVQISLSRLGGPPDPDQTQLPGAPQDTIRLRVCGPAVPEFSPETLSGPAAIPRRMLTQFALQLHGKLTIRSDGDRSLVELIFPGTPPGTAALSPAPPRAPA
ncbi:MAG: sensor histidine kinase [Gemmobacter sp.]|uniref:sensor histidine kinase n=1 Tax=Gemmobacter sp. TaxID=1898957 RepID=UPI001A56D6A1|nr:sensor histidine kinase [Gemmobacter sp.]MBL8561055.1 sensor histidine kinase [Gemmobacter sp.]